MDAKQLAEIRHDLDHIFPDGGYRLEWQDEKPLQLVLSESVRGSVQQFAEEVVRLHSVRFETVRTGSKGPKAAKRKAATTRQVKKGRP